MSHQLSQGHGPLFLRERRHVDLYVGVEIQPAFLHKPADGGRGERAGRISDPEPRLWRDEHPFLEVRVAKAFGPHDVVADTDRHREPRQVLLGETRTNDLLGLLHRVGPLGRWGRTPYGLHRLRIRVQRPRGGGHVRIQPHDEREQQADRQADQRQPGLDPASWHAGSKCSGFISSSRPWELGSWLPVCSNFTMQSYLTSNPVSSGFWRLMS